ncbi:MAG: neutral zinc metallopeptidase [Sphingomicrobium sp.]
MCDDRNEGSATTDMGRIVLITLPILLAALATSAPARPHPSPATERRAFADRILASTNVEWSDYFALRGRAYKSPGRMFMHLPDGHPARGFGYFRKLGINVELSDMIDIQRAQPASADLITALIIAHEVAHHVQSELEEADENHRVANMDRELEADCAAGWWLAKANARNLNAIGKPFLLVQDIAVELPRALHLLSGAKEEARTQDVKTHGGVGNRVSAIQSGMRSPMVEDCGAGFRF